MNNFLQMHMDEELSSEFKIFNHFLHDLKERNHIYSRTAHPKTRFDENPISDITFKDC